jgi:hypothetical protein
MSIEPSQNGQIHGTVKKNETASLSRIPQQGHDQSIGSDSDVFRGNVPAAIPGGKVNRVLNYHTESLATPGHFIWHISIGICRMPSNWR